MTTAQLKASFGPWMAFPILGAGTFEILTKSGKQIALVEESGDAAIMASSKEMLEALIGVYSITETMPEDDPFREQIEEVLSLAFEKVYAESDA